MSTREKKMIASLKIEIFITFCMEDRQTLPVRSSCNAKPYESFNFENDHASRNVGLTLNKGTLLSLFVCLFVCLFVYTEFYTNDSMYHIVGHFRDNQLNT